MSTNTYSIFDFLKNCSGNWRNTLYVPCGFCSHPCRAKQRGVLVTADGYGRPQAISVVRYEAITGQRIAQHECVCTLRRHSVHAAFRESSFWAAGHDGVRTRSRQDREKTLRQASQRRQPRGGREEAIKSMLHGQTQGGSQVSVASQPDSLLRVVVIHTPSAALPHVPPELPFV